MSELLILIIKGILLISGLLMLMSQLLMRPPSYEDVSPEGWTESLCAQESTWPQKKDPKKPKIPLVRLNARPAGRSFGPETSNYKRF